VNAGAQAPLVVLAAGGTGGHLFPAEALSHALHRAGARVALITDTRAAEYAGNFPAESIHAVPAATPSGKSPVAMAKAALVLLKGGLAARQAIKQLKPAIVVGFGGYPTVPPVFAAALMGVPTLLHEQNAVIGRANRFLASRVKAIATGFAEVGGLTPEQAAKCTQVGNPVRPAVIEAASPYDEPEGRLNLLVFGGSQGARVMADIVPPAVQLLSPEERSRLAIVQQARAEDDERVRKIYSSLGIKFGSIHFVGIGGIGMSGIAEVLHNLGYKVQGSDRPTAPTSAPAREGHQTFVGHGPRISARPRSWSFDRDQEATIPELMAAREKRLPVVRRAEMLAELMRLPSCVAIGGTHGKTTTTSLVATLLEKLRARPDRDQWRHHQRLWHQCPHGRGEWMVVEADESDGTFLKLPADVAIITNIDPEHLDHYGTFDASRRPSAQFVENLPFYGFAVMCIDHPKCRRSSARSRTAASSPMARTRRPISV
jgi:hypothetical protein